MRKNLAILIIILSMFVLPILVSAAKLGDIGVWYSSSDKIYRWKQTYIPVWSTVVDDSIKSSKHVEYMNHAMTEWNNASEGKFNLYGVDSRSSAR